MASSITIPEQTRQILGTLKRNHPRWEWTIQKNPLDQSVVLIASNPSERKEVRYEHGQNILELADNLVGVKTEVKKSALTTQQQVHVNTIALDFDKALRAKYARGVEEHGGNLWEKHDILENAIEEAIDLVVYLFTLKQQVNKIISEVGKKKDEKSNG